MDRLDEMLDVASPLLRRVDELLETAGAPPDHGLWAELRRVRLLPGDACRAVAALQPEAFADAVPELRADARACADTAADLPPPGDWTGAAAETYDDLRRRTAAQLGGGPDSLDERLEATADLAVALTEWMSRTRADLATSLALVLISADALTLTTAASTAVASTATAPTATAPSAATLTATAFTPATLAPAPGISAADHEPVDPASAAPPTHTELLAAADVGERLLRAIADSYTEVMDLLHGSASLTTAVPM